MRTYQTLPTEDRERFNTGDYDIVGSLECPACGSVRLLANFDYYCKRCGATWPRVIFPVKGRTYVGNRSDHGSSCGC